MTVLSSNPDAHHSKKMLRSLPNGMVMKELESHERDREYYEVEKVFGTRFSYDGRYFLLKFSDCEIPYWIAARCCDRCPDLVEQFKKDMRWKKMPSKRGKSFYLPECLEGKPNRKRRLDETELTGGWGPSEKRRRISTCTIPEKPTATREVMRFPLLLDLLAAVLVVFVVGFHLSLIL